MITPLARVTRKGMRYVRLEARSYCQGYVLIDERATVNVEAGQLTYAYLVDLKSGERHGPIHNPTDLGAICTQDHFIVGSTSGAPSAFSFAEKRWHTLKLVLPAGETLRDAELVVPIEKQDGEAAELLVRAISSSGKAYHGLWLPTDDELEVTELPFTAVHQARYNGDAIELNALHFGPAVERRMFDGSTFTRRDQTQVMLSVDESITTLRSYPNTSRAIRFLSEGYTLLDDPARPVVLTPSGEEERLPLSDCGTSASLYEATHSPPAALFRCQTSSAPNTDTFVYWSPAGVRRHVQPELASTADGARAEEQLWVDMRSGSMWRGVNATTRIALTTEGHSARVLATSRRYDEQDYDARRQIDLYLVDAERGEEVFLHRYDCPGALYTYDESLSRVRLDCIVNTTKKFRHTVEWSEVIDLEKMTRWRAPKDRLIVAVLPDGRLVLSDQGKGSELVYGSAPQQLFLGRL